jgi:hypothetical protein
MWFCNLVPESVTTALLEKGGGVNVHDLGKRRSITS